MVFKADTTKAPIVGGYATIRPRSAIVAAALHEPKRQRDGGDHGNDEHDESSQ